MVPMRRKDREITDRAELEEIINRAEVCRLALWDGEWPYIVPLCFGYEAGVLYFHSAPVGRKIALLEREKRVAFACDLDTEVVKGASPCRWSMKYRSVTGYGEASFLEDQADKKKALGIIMAHYGERAADFSAAELAQVAVFQVRIVALSGKKAGY